MRKAILIIHGFAGGMYDQENLRNSLELVKKFDVYSFTLPGHDKYVVKGVTKDDWIKSSEEHIEALIKHGYKDIYLIGHSMGGIICSYLSTKYSQVKKLILLAPAYQFMSSKNGKINIFSSLKQVPTVIKRFSGIDELISRIIKFPIKTVKELEKMIVSYQNIPEKINIPTLIIHGTKDDMVPYKSSEDVFKKINSKSKKLIIVKGLSHNVMKDKYQKELIDIITIFLKKKNKKEDKIIII